MQNTFPVLDNSICKIEHDDDLTKLLRQTELIIWDEVPITQILYFEALYITLKNVISNCSNSN